MLALVFKKQKTKKYLLLNLIYFIFFMALYTLVDSFNLSYSQMSNTYGVGLVIANILINIIMAALSMMMLGLTSAQFDFSGKQSAGSNMSFISVIVGILTYGCTPCVISFFAAIGISFSVIALPLAGFPYKIGSLILLIIGFIFVLRSIMKTTCKVEIKQV